MDTQPVQAKADPAGRAAAGAAPQTGAAEIGLGALGGGAPLQPSAREALAPRFGGVVDQVRVHTGPAADEAAGQLGARAFTVGRDIVFGAGEYAPHSDEGRWLLAHEVTHVTQQRAGRAPSTRVSRVPTEGGVEDGRYSYSTHCGWIDWGHTNPGLARTLIAMVREASMRIARREQALAAAIAAESTPLVSEPSCAAAYEPGEVGASGSDAPSFTSNDRPSGLIEITLGGFGVGSSDSSKFESFAASIALTTQLFSQLRRTNYVYEISGFTDCIGAEARNLELRRQRGTEILTRIAVGASSGSVAGASSMVNARFVDAPLTSYLVSNAGRTGRAMNRGVLIRLIPQVAPESFTGPRMESSAPILGMMSGVTPTAELNRSLSEDEVLRVALGIFAIQSYDFEALQAWTDWIAQSSFSEEDLTSNLISFYRAARGYSSAEVRTFCDVWDTQRSLEKLDGYQFQVNRSWTPPNLPPGGAWPAEFSSIDPARPGDEIYRITEIFRETPVANARCRMEGMQIVCL